MTIATVTAKGQVVIPSQIRRTYHIKKGTKLLVEQRGNELVMRPVSEEYFRGMAGTLGTKGRLCRTLLSERAKDMARGG